LVVVIFPT